MTDGAGAAARAVLFDLDGTLVDTGPDIAAAVNRMLVDLGRAPEPLQRILEWVGDGSPHLVQRALVGGAERQPPAAETEHALALFLDHYRAGICDRSEPYPGARQVLERLRASGVRVGIVTNKPEQLSRRLLDALGLVRIFDVIVGGDTLAMKKPDPEPIRHACRVLGLGPEQVVYVGDSMIDCRAAQAAGVAMVAVSYGYNRGADLTKAPCAAIISGLEELPAILAGATTDSAYS
ncbi:MAG TPA: phosphoglycolate phosphatase [Arenicellales bacterium]|nr:phosphoglycolate phosphatase [Arenicellales bacterium]